MGTRINADRADKRFKIRPIHANPCPIRKQIYAGTTLLIILLVACQDDAVVPTATAVPTKKKIILRRHVVNLNLPCRAQRTVGQTELLLAGGGERGRQADESERQARPARNVPEGDHGAPRSPKGVFAA